MEDIKNKIQQALAGSNVEVFDVSAGHEDHNPGAHVEVHVTYEGFEGKSVLQQHQMINNILKEDLKERIHALIIKTKVR